MNKYFHAMYIFIMIVYDFVDWSVGATLMHIKEEMDFGNPDSGSDRIVSPCWCICRTSSRVLSTMQFNVPGMISYVVQWRHSWGAFITLLLRDYS